MNVFCAKIARIIGGIMLAEKLLTPQELAETCSVPIGWVYSHVRLGKLPYFKLGHYVRFNADEVAAWLVAQRRGPGREISGNRGDEKGYGPRNIVAE
jgi:excisionase family DNA binding protein